MRFRHWPYMLSGGAFPLRQTDSVPFKLRSFTSNYIHNDIEPLIFFLKDHSTTLRYLHLEIIYPYPIRNWYGLSLPVLETLRTGNGGLVEQVIRNGRVSELRMDLALDAQRLLGGSSHPRPIPSVKRLRLSVQGMCTTRQLSELFPGLTNLEVSPEWVSEIMY